MPKKPHGKSGRSRNRAKSAFYRFSNLFRLLVFAIAYPLLDIAVTVLFWTLLRRIHKKREPSVLLSGYTVHVAPHSETSSPSPLFHSVANPVPDAYANRTHAPRAATARATLLFRRDNRAKLQRNQLYLCSRDPSSKSIPHIILHEFAKFQPGFYRSSRRICLTH